MSVRFRGAEEWVPAVMLFAAAASGHGRATAFALAGCTAFLWFRRSRSSAALGPVLAVSVLLLWRASWPLLWTVLPELRLRGISVSLLVPSCAFVPFAALALSRPRLAAATGLVLLVASGAFCVFLSGVADASGMPPSRMADALFLGRCAVLLAAAASAAYGGSRELGPAAARAALRAGIAFCLLAGAVSAARWAPPGRPVPEIPAVAFWSGSLDGGRFASVRDSPPGLDNIGLFGEVPGLLRSYGFRVGCLESLERISAREWDVLFLLTPPRAMSPAERGDVQAFVAGGGRLVVAAEHTDLDSNAACYNPLLERYGVRIAFDTTAGVCGDTVAGTSSSPDALGGLFRRSPHLAYNRGASLELRRPGGAEPVLCGDWWWSDAGDPEAAEKGLMGDGAWSPGEAFGRRVLVASCRPRGGGLVVVFADTSPFISRNMVYNSRFVAGFFGLVAGRPVDLSASRRRQLYFSTEECNAVPLQGFEDDAPTGLGAAALRAGLGFQVGDWRGLRAGDVLVIANPRRGVDRGRLYRHVAAGGAALVCGSGEDRAFRSLAGTLGCSFGPRPLGPLSDGVETLEAWEMSVPGDAADFTPLAVRGRCVGGSFRIGEGVLCLVCDRLFLSNRNIETETGLNEGNALFLSGMLRAESGISRNGGEVP